MNNVDKKKTLPNVFNEDHWNCYYVRYIIITRPPKSHSINFCVHTKNQEVIDCFIFYKVTHFNRYSWCFYLLFILKVIYRRAYDEPHLFNMTISVHTIISNYSPACIYSFIILTMQTRNYAIANSTE